MIDFQNARNIVIPEGEVAIIARGAEILWQKWASPIYTELEYIESNGTQWIDTGVHGNNNKLSFEFAFNLLQFRSYRGFFGNYVNENTNCWRFIQTGSNNQTGYVNVNGKAANSRQVNIHLKEVCTAYISREKILVDERSFSPLIVNGTVNDSSICLFNSGAKAASSDLRIYYFKIYDNEVLARDFIPVLDSNGVPCMYDKVTKELFYNQGTGEFSYASQII